MVGERRLCGWVSRTEGGQRQGKETAATHLIPAKQPLASIHLLAHYDLSVDIVIYYCENIRQAPQPSQAILLRCGAVEQKSTTSIRMDRKDGFPDQLGDWIPRLPQYSADWGLEQVLGEGQRQADV